MKPEDFRFPFPEEGPRVLIHDRLLYIPRYVAGGLEFQPLSWEEIFGNKNEVVIELGSGNGHWITSTAKNNPQLNCVAVEMRFDRVKKIWSKRANENLANLFIVAGEAFCFCHSFVNDHSVSEIHINFPDPWPKRRDEKHRLIKKSFVQEMARLLAPGGELCFVTDDQTYLQKAVSHFLADSRFHPRAAPPYYVEELFDVNGSTFETLWRSLGRKIYSLKVERITTSRGDEEELPLPGISLPVCPLAGRQKDL